MPLDKTDYEMTVMVLEQHYPEIMKRMKEGIFTVNEAGFIIYGIVRTGVDGGEFRIHCNKNFIKGLINVSELVEYIMD